MIQDVNVAVLSAPVALKDNVSTSAVMVSTNLGSKVVKNARPGGHPRTFCCMAKTLEHC